MAREKRWPSRWWFWIVPILANVYLALFFAALWALECGVFRGGVFTGRLRTFLHLAARVSILPAKLFVDGLFGPLMEVLNVDARSLGEPAALVLISGLWELCAVAAGLLVYGAAALVCVIVPREESGQEGSADG